MTITIKKRQRSQPEFYIYYNDWTGEILSVGRSLRTNTPAPYIVTKSKIAADIIAGTRSENQYIVKQTETTGQLVKKSDFLRLREKEDSLFLIPRTRGTEWNIRVSFFAKNKKIVVEVNPVFINRLVSFKMREEIALDQQATFVFYIVKRDQPDYLIDKIEVDATDLIRNRVLVFDYPEIERYANADDIDILTQRYFEFYQFRIIHENFIDKQSKRSAWAPENKWYIVGQDKDSHFSITQTDSIMTVSTNVDVENFNSLEIYERYLKMYVVGDVPDQYLDYFDLDLSKLRMGVVEKFEIDFDLDEVNILHQNSKLKINKRKQDVAHSN